MGSDEDASALYPRRHAVNSNTLKLTQMSTTRRSLYARSDGHFSEGAEVIKLHIEGSLTIPASRLKGYNYGMLTKKA